MISSLTRLGMVIFFFSSVTYATPPSLRDLTTRSLLFKIRQSLSTLKADPQNKEAKETIFTILQPGLPLEIRSAFIEALPRRSVLILESLQISHLQKLFEEYWANREYIIDISENKLDSQELDITLSSILTSSIQKIWIKSNNRINSNFSADNQKKILGTLLQMKKLRTIRDVDHLFHSSFSDNIENFKTPNFSVFEMNGRFLESDHPEILEEMFRLFPNVTQLRIHSNLKWPQLFRILKTQSHIQSLNTDINNELQAADLISSLPELREFVMNEGWITATHILTSTIARHPYLHQISLKLRNPPHLQHLEPLRGNSRITSLKLSIFSGPELSSSLDILATLSSLRSLEIIGNIDSNKMAALGTLPHLQTLKLRLWYGLNPDLSATIGQFRHLRELQLEVRSNQHPHQVLVPGFFRNFKPDNEIEILNLKNIYLGSENAADLPRYLRVLQAIELDTSGMIDDDFSHLTQLNHLEKLIAPHAHIGPVTANQLFLLPSLRTLKAQIDDLASLKKVLHLPVLSSLEVEAESNPFELDLEAAQMLFSHTHLRHIVFNQNKNTLLIPDKIVTQLKSITAPLQTIQFTGGYLLRNSFVKLLQIPTLQEVSGSFFSIYPDIDTANQGRNDFRYQITSPQATDELRTHGDIAEQ